MAKNPRCPVCRSKRWHRDRNSGQIVCEEGHVLPNYIQEDNEAEGPSQFTQRRRKLRKDRKAKERVFANPDLFHGRQLHFLYFQIAQIVLRRQIQQIIAQWDLPAELETVARDLWAMYTSLVDLEAEPFRHLDDDEDVKKLEEELEKTQDPLDELYRQLSDVEDSEEEDEESRQAMAAVGDVDKQPEAATSLPRRKHKPHQPFDPTKRLKLQYTLVICYLSCLTLRIPILMKDLMDLVEAHKIDYLEVLSHIPAELRKHVDSSLFDRRLVDSHVPKIFGDTASDHTAPGFAHLTTALARTLHGAYGVDFPEVNAAPVLWKCVERLGLPPMVYIACRRLLVAARASLSLDLVREVPSYHRSYPDLVLSAAVTTALKLLWGLDDVSRVPQDKYDVSSGLPRLEVWLAFIEDLNTRMPFTLLPKGGYSNDVSELGEKDIDDFLDFFQNSLLVNAASDRPVLGVLRGPFGTASTLDKFFPLSPAPEAPTSLDTNEARQEEIQAFYSEAVAPLPDEAVEGERLHPGQKHVIWNAYDRMGTPASVYRRVIALVGGVTDVRGVELEAAVASMEAALARSIVGISTGVNAKARETSA